MEDVNSCPCCGQDRPHPTRPGLWEFNDGIRDPWNPARIEYRKESDPDWRAPDGFGESDIKDDDDTFLAFIPEYDTGVPADETGDHKGEPAWWPGNARWRKRT